MMYAVLPLSEQVGLIEWVDQTKTLKALVCDEVERRSAAQAQLSSGTAGRGSRAPKPTGPSCLEAAAIKYAEIYPDNPSYISNLKTASVAAHFETIEACVPADLLSRAVALLSVSPEVSAVRALSP